MGQTLIEPRTLRGFRDYPPELQLPREELLAKARQVYRSYGYLPMDTPALEYAAASCPWHVVIPGHTLAAAFLFPRLVPGC